MLLLTRALPAWHTQRPVAARGGVLSVPFARRHAAASSCAAGGGLDDAWELPRGWQQALGQELTKPYFAEV